MRYGRDEMRVKLDEFDRLCSEIGARLRADLAARLGERGHDVRFGPALREDGPSHALLADSLEVDGLVKVTFRGPMVMLTRIGRVEVIPFDCSDADENRRLVGWIEAALPPAREAKEQQDRRNAAVLGLEAVA